MGETQQQACAARAAGVSCRNPGTHQHLETHDVHERFWFYLCDEHQQAWSAGQLDLEALDPGRVVTYVE